MYKYIVNTLSVLLLVTVKLTAAPRIPDKCEAFRPAALNVILLHEKEALALANSKDFGQSTPPASRTYWVVYSDRENNQTYEGPSTSSAKCTTLNFNEELRIAKIQNGMALVYREGKPGVLYPEISSFSECKGWVPMKNLLLWQTCLANDAGIYNKALLCVNLDEIDDSANVQQSSGYMAPNTQASRKRGMTTDMNFYFVMKEENGMVLLATQSKMQGTTWNENLYCWVPKPSYVPWSQRSCLEPTWKHEDAEYFADNGIKIVVDPSSRMDSTEDEFAGSIPFTRKEYVRNRATQYIYRMEGDQLRYPILEGTNDKLYSLSTFSTQDGQIGGSGKKEKTPKEKADSILEAKLIKKQNINLAVVIDGTRSMEPYYEPVKEALLEAAQFFATGYKLKIGIVIYRDYADEPDGGLVNVMPMTSVKNTDRIAEFLDNGGSYGIKSHPDDKTYEEALFYGINTALESFSFPEGESNMMLVVGDCGNETEDDRAPKRIELEAKLVATDIHLMGFQVRNQDDMAYTKFNSAMLGMLKNTLNKNYAKQTMDSTQVAPSVKPKKLEDGYDFSADVPNQLYIGKYRNANSAVNNGEMAPKELAYLLQSSISEFSQTVQDQISLLRRTAEEEDIKGLLGGGKAATMNISQSYLLKTLGPDWAELMKESGAMLHFKGYSYKTHPSGRDYFKPIIFISDAEFQELLKRMSEPALAARATDHRDRQPYIQALKKLIQSLAPGITDKDMNELTNNDITRLIGGLHESADALVSYSLEDLNNPSVIPAPKYNGILKDFSDKYDRLKDIRENPHYKYVKKFNGEKYFWIPIEMLP